MNSNHIVEASKRVEHELGRESVDAPGRIFLQWNGDAEPSPTQPPSLADVTWCKEKVFEHDEEYVRLADYRELADAALWLARACRDRLPIGHFAKIDEEYEAVRAIFPPQSL